MADEGFLLLALPDPCLLHVLQCCAANDQRSLFNAARAHSKLHQAAVVALRSISLHVSQQQQIDGVMVYLGKHHQHVDSFELVGAGAPSNQLRQLPQQLQLTSLQLERLVLQLQPGNGFQSVLGAATAALKQLRLSICQLIGFGASQALGALSQLPAGLEHLSIRELYGGGQSFPAGVLQQLQQLTYLELDQVVLVRPDEASPVLQPLQALTRLVVLRLEDVQGVVTCAMLSGMQRLTHLGLSVYLQGFELEPGALAGKTQLQGLCLNKCSVLGGAAGVAQLLSHLQPMQQLTHLTLESSLQEVEGSNPPAAAYAALTASSKLQHLDIVGCTLPTGVWQYVFPTGRQLPNLRSLDITDVWEPPHLDIAPAPEASLLISCCPGLQSLKIGSLQGSAELLAASEGLSGLRTLHCNFKDATTEKVQAVCQLTGLRELEVEGSGLMEEEGLLMQLTQLQQLTRLSYRDTGWPSNEIDLLGEAGVGVHNFSQIYGCIFACLSCLVAAACHIQQHQAGCMPCSSMSPLSLSGSGASLQPLDSKAPYVQDHKPPSMFCLHHLNGVVCMVRGSDDFTARHFN